MIRPRGCVLSNYYTAFSAKNQEKNAKKPPMRPFFDAAAARTEKWLRDYPLKNETMLEKSLFPV